MQVTFASEEISQGGIAPAKPKTEESGAAANVVIAQESTIAELDLQNYYNEDTHEQFIEDVRAALHIDGFFALKNTGVNKEIINKAYASLMKFFALPTETKMLSDGAHTSQQRGYAKMGTEAAKGSPYGDFKEYYSVGRVGGVGMWDNIWPTCMDLCTPLTAYFEQMDHYSLILMEIFSVALGEDPKFLEKIAFDGDSSARLIHYPADQSNFNKDAVWSRAHTDINLFTILPRATERGLELQDRNGKWKPVYVNNDAFVINCGDMLEVFSNGYFLSAVHRVKKPRNMKKDRYSSVMFVHPRRSADVYPIPRWIEKVGEQRFIKATALELFAERLADMAVASDDLLEFLGKSGLVERLMEVHRESKDAMEALVKAGYASECVKQRLKELQNEK